MPAPALPTAKHPRVLWSYDAGIDRDGLDAAIEAQRAGHEIRVVWGAPNRTLVWYVRPEGIR